MQEKSKSRIASHYQFETIKHQCESFRGIGFTYRLKIGGNFKHIEAEVVLIEERNGGKVYKFCDHDFDIVISQLAKLYISKKRHLVYLNQYNTTMH